MIRKLLLAALALACVCVALVLPFSAFAAEGTTVSAGGLYELVQPYLLVLLSTLVTAAIGWACAAFTRATGVTIEKQYQDSLHKALMTGITAGLGRLGIVASAATFDVRSRLIADAIVWAEHSVPDAIAKLGAGPDQLATLASSKLAILAHGSAAAGAPTTA